MQEEILIIEGPDGVDLSVPLTTVHTLVVGSGAAGLNSAVQLVANGITDILILSEGLRKGTSINTGSDKQTYYKLSMCGTDADAPGIMAQTYFEGGSMHGDLAMVEASLSARAFINLVNIGVPFPRDAYGQFVGYKTDHDPRQRATSIGPYTSREMCRALIREVKRQGTEIRERRNVVQLLTEGEDEKRVVGAIAVTDKGDLEAYAADNIVFAVGGPGGIYKTSVYPDVHTGAVGVAFMAGATAQSLPESQYGMASIKFRWNVSGTYMQVIPRFISTDQDGTSNPTEFLREYFENTGELNSNVFLKGYQWPFDSRKVMGGSSILDILVYIETVIRGRRVYLDFRSNPEDFAFNTLSSEAHEYLKKSDALLDTPIERLAKMNPGAIQLYSEHGIDIAVEPLEIAVCAQHNNGGLAGNHWWESTNIKHLFPVGEVNGSHGAYRPGGSALNSGQVGSFRAAEFIANRYSESIIPTDDAKNQAYTAVKEALQNISQWIRQSKDSPSTWEEERSEFQERMTRAGAHIRSPEELPSAVTAAWDQVARLDSRGCRYSDASGLIEALKNRHLCYAHAVYLEAALFALRSGVGSRGSAIVMDPDGDHVHAKLGSEWAMVQENEEFRNKVLETRINGARDVVSEWIDRRPIPESDLWFETAWASFRNGEIYD